MTRDKTVSEGVSILSTKFYTTLLNEGAEYVRSWTRTNKRRTRGSLFKKKLLIIPSKWVVELTMKLITLSQHSPFAINEKYTEGTCIGPCVSL